MRRETRHSSARLCLLGHWASGGRYTGAMHMYPAEGIHAQCTCTPAPVTFAHSHIRAHTFPVNAVVRTTARTNHLTAARRARRVQPVVLGG